MISTHSSACVSLRQQSRCAGRIRAKACIPLFRARITDYENGRDLGTVRGPAASLEVQFDRHLLLEALAQ